MSQRLPAPPAPGPLEEYATLFDPLFGDVDQQRGFREYVQGLLLPRDRNKTITAVAGAAPNTQAQAAPVPSLQFFLSESPSPVGALLVWDNLAGQRTPALVAWCVERG